MEAAPAGPAAGTTPPRAPATLSALFRVFNRMSLQGFGGVLPVAQYHLVDREQWLTKQQFVEMLSMGQMLPGPNVVNLSLMVGDRYFGWRGAMAALAGMLLIPTAIVLVLASLYAHFAALPAVAGALRGMGAVSAGLVIATGLKMVPTLSANPLGRGTCAIVAVLTFVAVGALHWPLLWVLIVLGGASIVLAWRRIGSATAPRDNDLNMTP